MSIVVNINGEQYKVPTELGDITLRRHIALRKLENEAPEVLKKIFEEEDQDKRTKLAQKIKPVTYAKKVLPFFARYINAATDIPVNVLLGDKDHEGAPIGLIENWYWRIQRAYFTGIGDKDKRVFDIGGKVYELPKAKMVNGTFGEFAEAAQYEQIASEASPENHDHLPYLIAVILRPQGEPFDPYTFDDIIEERAELMRDLPMTDVQTIAFFLTIRNEAYALDSKIYMAAQTLTWLKRGQFKYNRHSAGT